MGAVLLSRNFCCLPRMRKAGKECPLSTKHLSISDVLSASESLRGSKSWHRSMCGQWATSAELSHVAVAPVLLLCHRT
eukprot:4646098-Amphidinium_carterae.5